MALACEVVPVGKNLKVVVSFEGQKHEVHPLRSTAEAALVCDVLSLKRALDAGRDASALQLQSRDGPPCLELLANPSRPWASLDIHELADHLQACAQLVQPTAGAHLVHGAAMSGSSAALQLMLAAAPAAASATTRAGTPFHQAAKQGHAAAVRLLLQAAPASASAVDMFELQPLHWAVAQGRAQVVAELLAAGPAAVAAAAPAALYQAAESGHTAVVELLLEAAPAAAAAPASNAQGQTPLHAAAANGHCGAAAALLRAAANPAAAAAAADRYGWSPLHAAAHGGHCGVLQLLLRATPAATALAKSSGRTPLEVALRQGHAAAARCLLPAVPCSHALEAVAAAGPAFQQLYADAVAAHASLSPEQWARVPVPCPGLGRALPAVLARSAEQARQVVARLPEADVHRLRTFALCLARIQRDSGTAFPALVVQKTLALFDA